MKRFLIILSFLISSCKPLIYKDYKGGNFFKIKGGSIYVLQQTTEIDSFTKLFEDYLNIENIITSVNHKPIYLKPVSNLNKSDTSRNLTLIVNFNKLRYHFTRLASEYATDGSAEKMIKFDVFIRNHKRKFKISKFNICDTVISNSFLLITDSTKTKIIYLSKGEYYYSKVRTNSILCFDSIKDFINNFK